MGLLLFGLLVLFLWWLNKPLLKSGTSANSPQVNRPPASANPVVEPLAPVSIPRTDLPPDVTRMIAQLSDRSLDQLQRQWLNTVSMIDRASPDRVAPLIAFRHALSAEWARRLALAEQNPTAFPWPSTKAPKGKSGLDSGDWHLLGMLSYLGYRVGKTNGAPDGVRRQILDLCFDGALPPINGLTYLRDWNAPGTTMRLRKLANELASFARNGKRKRSANLSSAVADWEADLNYLYRRYYVGKFRFAWPRVD